MLFRFDALEDTFTLMDRIQHQVQHSIEENAAVLRRDRCWDDLQEDDEQLSLRADLPGIRDEDLEISLLGEVLSISASRKLEHPKGRLHLQERRAFKFTRSFSLPSRIDPEGVKAELRDGVLNVTLKKAPELQPRQIQVNV